MNNIKFDPFWIVKNDLPFVFSNSKICIFENSLHVFGGGTCKEHYKFDGENWQRENDLPIALRDGLIVNYNNKIHVYGEKIGGVNKFHISYNGKEWQKEKDYPKYCYFNSSILEFNNKIHIFYNKYHEVFDGKTWKITKSLPYNFSNGAATIYNNQIHLIGGEDNERFHYYLYHDTWCRTKDLPFDFSYGNGIELNNKLHLICTTYDGENKHYSLNRHNKWIEEEALTDEIKEVKAAKLGNRFIVFGENTNKYALYPRFPYVNN